MLKQWNIIKKQKIRKGEQNNRKKKNVNTLNQRNKEQQKVIEQH